MNDADRIQELIDGHLDETLSPGERVELDRVLAAEPEAVRRFVRAVRQDNALHLHFHRRSAESVAATALARIQPVAPARPRWAATVDHVWGPLGAVLAHAALILILVRWVVLPITRPSRPVEVVFHREESLSLDAPRWERRPWLAPVDGPPPLYEPVAAVRPPDPGTPDAFPVPAPPPDIAARGGRLWDWPEWMAGRMPDGRGARLRRYAPDWSSRTEPALDVAFDWLAAARRADGLWSAPGAPEADPVLTSLAMLALLSRGESLLSVQTAALWLVERQGADGAIPSAGRLDAHGVSACALIEAYARAPLPPLRAAAERAVESILREQTERGLWSEDEAWTTSWRILALRTAAWAKLDAPGLRAGLSRAVAGLKTVEDPAGSLFRGARPAAREVERVAAAALALQWLGEGRSPEARSALAALARIRVDDRDAGLTPFAVHLLTQTRFNEGGETWSRARGPLADTLLAGQASDGGWHAGDADTGRISATALAALSLTVCYRYPPSSEWPAFARNAVERNTFSVSPGNPNASGAYARVGVFRQRFEKL